MIHFFQGHLWSWLLIAITYAGVNINSLKDTASTAVPGWYVLAGTDSVAKRNVVPGSKAQPMPDSQQVTAVVFPSLKTACYVLFQEKIYFIGGYRDASINYLRRAASWKEVTALKEMLSIAGHSDFRETGYGDSVMKGFKKLIVQDERELDVILDAMRANTIADRRERGTFILLSEQEHEWRVELRQGFIVGNEQQVEFRFLVNKHGAVRLLDRDNNLVIGTMHLHTHNHGLSGSGQPLEDTESDARNVIETKIPWVTMGPQKIHIGYINRYQRFVMEEPGNSNLLVEVFRKNAISLAKEQ